MTSYSLEQLEKLGGELVRYIPRLGSPKMVRALIEPIRRTDELGNKNFLTKTYDVFICRDATEGITSVAVNVDQIALKLNKGDRAETFLKVTKIHPEREEGNLLPDGVGLWHLEAVQ